jgi:hypothetical protein
VLAFIGRINAHDVEGLGALMSDDHTTFIDAHGNRIVGREIMIVGWRAYFELFPDYSIEVNEIFENGDTFAMFGFANGPGSGPPILPRAEGAQCDSIANIAFAVIDSIGRREFSLYFALSALRFLK